MGRKILSGNAVAKSSVVFVKVYSPLRRCFTCREMVFVRDGTPYDPDESGKGFVPHPCDWGEGPRLQLTQAGKSGVISGHRRRTVGGDDDSPTQTLSVCRVPTCPNKLSTMLRVKQWSLCAHHFCQLPRKLQDAVTGAIYSPRRGITARMIDRYLRKLNPREQK